MFFCINHHNRPVSKEELNSTGLKGLLCGLRSVDYNQCYLDFELQCLCVIESCSKLILLIFFLSCRTFGDTINLLLKIMLIYLDCYFKNVWSFWSSVSITLVVIWFCTCLLVSFLKWCFIFIHCFVLLHNIIIVIIALSLLITRHDNITLPLVEDILLPPPYVVRLVIVYGRSHCMPRVSTQAKQVCLWEFICLSFYRFKIKWLTSHCTIS